MSKRTMKQTDTIFSESNLKPYRTHEGKVTQKAYESGYHTFILQMIDSVATEKTVPSFDIPRNGKLRTNYA